MRLCCAVGVQRRGRRPGIAIYPARVREARQATGLSLAEIAGSEVSRTLIHFIEHGKTKPSKRVLELIATRTGKPVSYFVVPSQASLPERAERVSVGRQLTDLATQTRRLAADQRLTKSEMESIKLVELVLRQAASLTDSIETRLLSVAKVPSVRKLH